MLFRSGNVLGKGYAAGIGMAIGTVFGRAAGVQAAQVALAARKKPMEFAHAST